MTEPMRKSKVISRTAYIEAGLAATALAVARKRPIAGAALIATGALAARGAFGRNSRIFGHVDDRGPSDRPRVALTFDDGPGPSTPAILDALAINAVRATFFVLGRQVESHPQIIQRYG